VDVLQQEEKGSKIVRLKWCFMQAHDLAVSVTQPAIPSRKMFPVVALCQKGASAIQ
jgi:hypothetical protein